jgi:hypothetical protein
MDRCKGNAKVVRHRVDAVGNSRRPAAAETPGRKHGFHRIFHHGDGIFLFLAAPGAPEILRLRSVRPIAVSETSPSEIHYNVVLQGTQLTEKTGAFGKFGYSAEGETLFANMTIVRPRRPYSGVSK